MTVLGLDVSDNQAGLDLNRAFDQGYEFVTARCVIGNYRDTRYPTFRDVAKARGKLFAAYVFPHTDVPWSTHAALTKEWIGDPSIPIMLDTEPDPAHGSRPPTLADCQALTAALRAEGLKVASFYSYDYFARTLGAVASLGLALVMANYGTNASGYGSALYPGDTSPRWGPYVEGPVTLLQFGSNGVIDGYAGRVDLDAYRGTLAQLKATGLFTDWSDVALTPQEIAAIAAAVHNYNYHNAETKVDMTYESRFFDVAGRLLGDPSGSDHTLSVSVASRLVMVDTAVAALKAELDAVKAAQAAGQADLDQKLAQILTAVQGVTGPAGPAGPPGPAGTVDPAAVAHALAGTSTPATVTFPAATS